MLLPQVELLVGTQATKAQHAREKGVEEFRLQYGKVDWMSGKHCDPYGDRSDDHLDGKSDPTDPSDHRTPSSLELVITGSIDLVDFNLTGDDSEVT